MKIQTRFSILIGVVMFTSLFFSCEENRPPEIMKPLNTDLILPKPVEVSPGQGPAFIINALTTVRATGEGATTQVQQLVDYLKTLTNYPLVISEEAIPHQIVLAILPKDQQNETLGEEGYLNCVPLMNH